MIRYKDLESSAYKTVGVQSVPLTVDPDLSDKDPVNVVPSTFIFDRLGPTGDDTAKLTLQSGEFLNSGFDGIPPEAVLLALRAHFEGLQSSDLACNEFRMAFESLDDIVEMLKTRNERRDYYKTYGTVKP